MGFTAASLMQGGALVHVYMDGTVLVTHGGVELGQGIHTKCAMVCSHRGPLHCCHAQALYTWQPGSFPLTSPASFVAGAVLSWQCTKQALHHLTAPADEAHVQVAAQALDIPLHLIHIAETSTDKVCSRPGSAAKGDAGAHEPLACWDSATGMSSWCTARPSYCFCCLSLHRSCNTAGCHKAPSAHPGCKSQQVRHLHGLQVPNMSPSAASASSDLYCAAVDETCRQLRERLQPFRKDKAWEEAVKAAYGARTDLSAHGFHATPDITGGHMTSRCIPCRSRLVRQRLQLCTRLACPGPGSPHH